MTAAPALRKALLYGAVVALVVGVVGALVGGILEGPRGVASALVGAGMAALFLSITAGSILLAGHLTRADPGSPLFFVVVLGSWLVKFVIFIALVLLLRDQPFLHPVVLYVSLVVAAVGGVLADALAVLRSRVPYVTEISSDSSGSDG